MYYKSAHVTHMYAMIGYDCTTRVIPWLYEAYRMKNWGGHDFYNGIYPFVINKVWVFPTHYFFCFGYVLGCFLDSSRRFLDPQPLYSAFREASFGHAELAIESDTEASYTWYAYISLPPSIYFSHRYQYNHVFVSTFVVKCCPLFHVSFFTVLLMLIVLFVSYCMESVRVLIKSLCLRIGYFKFPIREGVFPIVR